MWDQTTAALTAVGYRIVRCDLRGCGCTPRERGEPYGADILELVEGLGLTSFAPVGASYGGYIAQQVATALPDRVERLVLICTAGDLVEPDAGLRAFWQDEQQLLEAGDVGGATELTVATWLGPHADDGA